MNQISTAAVVRPSDVAPRDQMLLSVRESASSSAISNYLRIARRWKWLIVGSVAAGITIALIVTLLMPRLYAATSTIEIARDEARVLNVDGVEPKGGSVDQEFYQTQYGLLASHSLAERVAKDLRLADDANFLRVTGLQAPDGTPVDNSASGRENRIRTIGNALLSRLRIDPVRLSRLVKITFTSPDPVLSARIANAWGRLFIQMNIERRYDATAYARHFLEGRLSDLRSKLDESERELVSYSARQRIVNVPGSASQGDHPIVSDDLVAYNTALAAARSQRIAAESALAQAGTSSTASVNNPTLSALRQQRAQVSAELAKLRAQFEPQYPPVIALAAQLRQIDTAIDGEQGRVTGSLRGDYRQAVQRENELSARVETLKRDLIDLRGRSIQYNILQREVDTNRTLYDGLLQRYKEIGVAGGVGTNNISSVDEAAVPVSTSSPRPLVNLAIGILAGLLTGAVLAFAFDQIDEMITDPAEMERILGVPSLGVVPKLEGEDPQAALEDRRSITTEAYLTIKTNLQFATSSGVPRSLLITSTRASEGKSTTSMALAVVLERQGLKVALIDADMRSPSLHGLLGLTNEIGLSSVLSGNADWRSAMRPTHFPGIQVMAAGPHPPNAADLLSGVTLPKLIQDLEGEFDHIVIDAPPMLGLADAPLLASNVGGVVYVVESFGVSSRLAKLAMGRLLNSGAPVLGAVLTKFVSQKAGYGYGYDYGYGYGQADRT